MTDDSTVPFAALGRSVSHSGRGAPSTEAAYRELWAARRLLQAVRAVIADADWEAGTRSHPMGDPKAGLSEDLDALAAYVASLETPQKSPYREQDGALTPAAQNGKTLFESPALGCVDCHAGPRLTDSAFLEPQVPLLHDVGTIKPSSGQRLGEPLTGLDTPTLHGLWRTAPYLHDGSAPTLFDVLTSENPDEQHGGTGGLSDDALADLIAYLMSLDGTQD